jgi:hypothetical protein
MVYGDAMKSEEVINVEVPISYLDMSRGQVELSLPRC